MTTLELISAIAFALSCITVLLALRYYLASRRHRDSFAGDRELYFSLIFTGATLILGAVGLTAYAQTEVASAGVGLMAGAGLVVLGLSVHNWVRFRKEVCGK